MESDAVTLDLLDRARRGDRAAVEELFGKHRSRLRRAIALRLDRRVAARADASDVLQETYLEAARRLPAYLEKPELPFYLWLHWLAREKVISLHRRHLGAGKRALGCEVAPLPQDSSVRFLSALMERGPTPSQQLAAAELVKHLGRALERLDRDDRDLILWRHFEQLTARDTALLLQISEAAASKRYVRALERLRRLLVEEGIK
jgi:RNA polymerase sigma-70 factor (ECF subfamily)